MVSCQTNSPNTLFSLTSPRTTEINFKNIVRESEEFNVNVFLTDLDNWPRFNEDYSPYFEDPKPVRTAVQTPLLFTLLVEIEMWAVKK